LVWFFNQWVLRGGTPELEVKYRWDTERGRALVTVEQTQEIDAEYPPFEFALDLYFKVAGKSRSERVRVREPTHQFEIALDAQPEVFCVDPGGRLLKSLELSKPAALWIAQIRGGPTALSRTQAILHLRSQEEQVAAAGDALKAALCDAAEYSGVRRRAASALQRLDPPGALDAFLAAERSADDDPRLLTAVVRALGRHPDSLRAHAAVLRRAADAEPGDVRTAALTALCRFEATVCTDETFTKLGAALGGAAARRRQTVLKAFERWKDVRTLEPLIEATPPDAGVRTSELRRRLRLIADLGASDSAARPRAAYHLLAFVENSKAAVRRAAVEGLGKIGGEFHITALTALTEQDQDDAVREAARAAIEAIQERLDNEP
jgi:aminopeptidase N